MKSLNALGLFSGCGGLDLGAKLAGFRLLHAFDNDEVSVETYQKNVSSNISLADLSKFEIPYFGEKVDLLLGGPPCQGFSSAGPKKENDERNSLWKNYLNVLRDTKPKAFVMENVWGFLRDYEKFSATLNNFLSKTYIFNVHKVNTRFYGVPQHRLRVFIVGIDRSISQEIPWPEPIVEEFWGWKEMPDGLLTMKDALQDLGPASNCENIRDRGWGNPHEFVTLEKTHSLVAPNIPNGGSLRSIPDNFLPDNYRGRKRTNKGWPWYYRKPDPNLSPRTVTAAIGPCYSQILAPDVKPKKIGNNWTWEIINPAEFTDKNGLYTSPVKQRRLSIKECARLQTFPDSFQFYGNMLEKHRQIGNAVPVEFARQLCSSIASVLNR